jgi:hypothetical protein
VEVLLLDDCQREVPEANVVVSLAVYGLTVTREVLKLEVDAWSRLRDGTGVAWVILFRTGVAGVVGDWEMAGAFKPALLVVLDIGLEAGAWVGVESTKEMEPADPRLIVWERLWGDGEVFEIALEFSDMEAPVLKQGCCPAPVLALPLMFLDALKEVVQTSFSVGRGWVSTGWVGFKRPAFESAVGVGSVGWFVNWVRELGNGMDVKATGAWLIYAVKARGPEPLSWTNKALWDVEGQRALFVGEQGNVDKAIVHSVASL